MEEEEDENEGGKRGRGSGADARMSHGNQLTIIFILIIIIVITRISSTLRHAKPCQGPTPRPRGSCCCCCLLDPSFSSRSESSDPQPGSQRPEAVESAAHAAGFARRKRAAARFNACRL